MRVKSQRVVNVKSDIISDFHLLEKEKEDISAISANCLTLSLQTIGIAYDIICDSRVSICANAFLLSKPPIEYDQYQSDNSHNTKELWKIVRNHDRSKITQLTEYGKLWFEEINLLTPQAFKMDKTPVPEDYFEKQFLRLVLDQNHTLCDNSLTILRRSFGIFI